MATLSRVLGRSYTVPALGAFSLVGLLGVFIQLSALAALIGFLGMHYLVATGLAVEAAVLHNFVWHERWTCQIAWAWKTPDMWKRLVRFHVANVAIPRREPHPDAALGGTLLNELRGREYGVDYYLLNPELPGPATDLYFSNSERGSTGRGTPSLWSLRVPPS